MKLLLTLILAFISLQAENFTKEKLLGSWELSSAKTNSSVAIGTYTGKKRNETLELRFNTKGQMKIVQTGDVYNYEVIQGQLKFYDTKVYRNDYRVKRKNRYDLLKIVGDAEGCLEVKVVKKKIPGYTSRNNLKMCKTANYPQATYNENISKYNF